MFDPPSVLDPRGPGAEQIAGLTWLIFALGAAVFALVMAILLLSIVRRRRHRPVAARSQTIFILVSGALVPAAILALLMVLMVRTGDVVTLPDDDDNIRLQVVGHKWWWEVQYPDYGVTTANEIHIPAGRRVQLEMTSMDVIHSFWVPQLQGKIDLTPGHITTLSIQADEPGTYRGTCAEYCGVQHARHSLIVVAQEPRAFDDWIEQQSRPGAEPQTDSEVRGQQVFMETTCVACHTIAGTPASADAGPDLTHLATRQMLFAAQYPNTRENLSDVILDPQRLKPGNHMPPTSLGPEDLEALLDYLMSLR
jgi:cytochrome c oxidase subunit II